MTQAEFIVGNLSIDLVRKNIKNMHLAVYPPTGRIRLAVPIHTPEETMRLFVISKIAWIRQQQRKFEAQARQSPREFRERESHYFQGRRYLLRIKEHDSTPQVVVRSKTYIDMYVKPHITQEQRQVIHNEWYRAELKKIIPTMIEKWQSIIGVEVNEWHIKQMKTKWGTCNIEQKRIWLNLELAKKPLHCLEYIIVHELVHLLERHHTDYFKALMDRYMPQWKFYKDELNKLPISYGEWDY
ncbi:MAG: M48 family metallopeptidase [Thermoflexibacteraceae bacterium]